MKRAGDEKQFTYFAWPYHCLRMRNIPANTFTPNIVYIYAAYFPGYTGSSDPLHLMWSAACGEKMPQCPLKCSSVDFSAAYGEKMLIC